MLPANLKDSYDASKHANPNDSKSEPRAWVFVGARTFDTALVPAVGIAIDDVHVYDGVLGDAALASIRDRSAGQSMAGAGVELPSESGEQPTLTGAASGRQPLPDQERIADEVTAVARQEAARASEGDGMTLEQLNEQLTSQNAEQSDGIDHESPADALAREEISEGKKLAHIVWMQSGHVDDAISKLLPQ